MAVAEGSAVGDAPTGAAVRFVFGLHIHQPWGNFDHVFQEHVDKVYRPTLTFLEERGLTPFAVHVSGPLLEWLEQHDRAVYDHIGRLAADGQVELLSCRLLRADSGGPGP